MSPGIVHDQVGMATKRADRSSGPPWSHVIRSFTGRASLARRNNNVDHAPAALGAELHRARSQGEQRVVATAADVLTGVEVGAALPDDDLAAVDELPAEA